MRPAEPFVSVVTPFYNTGQYLTHCIESVLTQAYENFEYLLVNNCSTDESVEIAERYARKNPRIRLIHNDSFLGQVDNYNQALTHISALSKYCKIVQADDWLFPNCLRDMVNVAELDNTVGLVSSYNLQEREVHMQGLPYPSVLVSGREICRTYLLKTTYFWGSPTTTLVRSEIIRSRQPFYDAHSLSEDIDVCLEILETWNFAFVHQVLTFTRRQNDSMMAVLMPYKIGILTALMVVRRYGSRFLSKQELRTRLRQVEHQYYMALGRAVLQLQPAAFWELHCKGLDFSGAGLNHLRLALYTVFAAIDLALSPKLALKSAIQAIRRQYSGKDGKIVVRHALILDASAAGKDATPAANLSPFRQRRVS